MTTPMTPDEANNTVWEAANCIAQGRTPPLAWFVRRDGGGRDPVAEAWRDATEDHAMRYLVIELGYETRTGEYRRPALCSDFCALSNCVQCCRVMRASWPTLTLADVVAAIERARGAA